MLTIDWILLAVLVMGAIRGWQLGCIRQLVSLVAFFVGLILAKMFYCMLGEALAPHLGDHATLANIVAFVLIWVAVPAVMGILGEMVSAVLGKLIILGTLNRMLGALLSLVKFIFIVGAVVWAFAAGDIIDQATIQSSPLCANLKAAPESLYTTLMEYGRQE